MTNLSTLGIVTRNRVDLLERSLTSYIEHAKAHGREPRFVVMDDSELESTRTQAIDRIRRLKDRFGGSFFYAGPEEKARFIALLAQESKVAPSTVQFALADPEGCTLTTGANRNALLLHTAGEVFLSVDDDTLCRLSAPLNEEPGLKFVSAPTLSDLEAFATPEDTLAAVRPVDQDFLDLNESLLGLGIDACMDRYGTEDIDIRSVTPFFAKRLLEPKGSIKMVWTGIVGDCGLTFPNYLLWLSGRARAKVLRDKLHYQAVCRSRQIVRMARKLSIGGDSGLFQSVALGLDNRELLPPFSPTYRGQDGVFGALYIRCLSDDFVAYPPRAILHDPRPVRVNKPEDVWKGGGGVDFNRLLKLCLLSYEPAASLSIAERMRAAGNFLVTLASQETPALEQVLRQELLKSDETALESLENLLRAYHGQPRYWAADVNACLRTVRELQKDPAYAIPREVRPGRSLPEALAACQRLMLRFGEVLSAWSELVEAAKRLKSRDILLARPV